MEAQVIVTNLHTEATNTRRVIMGNTDTKQENLRYCLKQSDVYMRVQSIQGRIQIAVFWGELE